ncbi:GNAT family N-acetyltransferase [Butyrivibrio sp. AD3002]|uniref:GNAT family N-acetyltransferase n=1 Tax=Butyrivibrio sp. AD3002 TaxID=1280670 RepID=UPI000423E281|nr:GNAT family N-acetyltransferase [Butyrivibrio sp. AD3002]
MNIRIMTESDLLNLYGTLSDSEVMKYIEAPYTLDKTKAFLEKAALIEKPLIYAAEDDNGNYIGYVIYHEYEQDTNEIGWILNKSAWGKGFAGKLTEMLIEKIRLDGKNAIIECSPKQEATKHIAGKYGFEYKGQKDGLDTFELKLNRKVFEETGAKALHLNVFSENIRAKKCYQKAGFTERSVKENAFSYKDETWGRCNMFKMLNGMIREVKREEISLCANIIKKSFKTVADEYGFTEENAPRFTAFATTDERLYWHMDGEHRPMYVFEVDGVLCGYYSLLLQDNNECELNNLAVLPEYRHKGIGKELLEHSFKIARSKGCSLMNIGIVEENTRLRKWYEDNGAVHVGTKKFDFFPFTCGYMKKEL